MLKSKGINIKRNSKDDDNEDNTNDNTTVNLNYSIYTDNIQNKINLGTSPDINPISNIYPKTNEKWVEESYVYQCQKCELKFGLLVRKHHCRACGGVFCYKCCDKYIEIPNNLIKAPTKDKSYKSMISSSYRWLFNKQKELVCKDCETKIIGLKEIEIIIKIFYYLDIKTLYNVSFVSKTYNKAAHYYITKFRDIQYKNMIEIYDNWEINIIFDSKEYLIFHNVWLTILIKTTYLYTKKVKKIDNLIILDEIIQSLTYDSLDIIKTKYRNVKCWNLLCSRKCGEILDFDDIVSIFHYITNEIMTDDIFWDNKINKNILSNLLLLLIKKCQNNIHNYIPLITKILINLFSYEIISLDYEYINKFFNIILFLHYDLESINVVLNESVIKIISLLLFEKFYIEDNYKNSKNVCNGSSSYFKQLISYIINKFGSEIINNIVKSNIAITKLINNATCDVSSRTDLQLPFIYPLNPNYLIFKINKKIILNSNTKPVLIEAEIINNKETKNVKFIIKKDKSLRKEQLISCLIDTMQNKLNTNDNSNTEENVPTYQILMITKDIGIIEYIEDSITLRMINQTGFTLQNYILNHNLNNKLDLIKSRFMYSLSVSSCISYIIGLGDRHLDNIMINKKGQLFHIDYGYIMENPMTTIFEMPQIKVTNEIIDFLGGSNSIYYDKFKKLVIKIYNILRANRNLINIYFKLICDEGYLKWETVEQKLNQKLMNGMKCKDIEITLVNEIESANSFTNMFVDICHTYRHKLF